METNEEFIAEQIRCWGSTVESYRVKRDYDKFFFHTISMAQKEVGFGRLMEIIDRKKDLDNRFYTKFEGFVELMDIFIVRG